MITKVLRHFFGLLFDVHVYLGIHSVPLQTGRKFLQDLTESLGHVVRHVVHSLQHGVREEAVRSKQGFHRWLKPLALHADLSRHNAQSQQHLLETYLGDQ